MMKVLLCKRRAKKRTRSVESLYLRMNAFHSSFYGNSCHQKWLSLYMQLSCFHKEALTRFFSSKPVKKAYLFGSYVRNDADQNSDIDILVELDHSHPIGMKFFSYKDELEQLLNIKVDLLSTQGLSHHIKPYIDKDKVLIYERTDT